MSLVRGRLRGQTVLAGSTRCTSSKVRESLPYICRGWTIVTLSVPLCPSPWAPPTLRFSLCPPVFSLHVSLPLPLSHPRSLWRSLSLCVYVCGCLSMCAFVCAYMRVLPPNDASVDEKSEGRLRQPFNLSVKTSDYNNSVGLLETTDVAISDRKRLS
jgi:hypothetical protein